MNKRQLRMIKEYMKTGKKSIAQIADYMNTNTKWGVTSNQLGSILKGKAFRKVGTGRNTEYELEDEKDGEKQ